MTTADSPYGTFAQQPNHLSTSGNYSHDESLTYSSSYHEAGVPPYGNDGGYPTPAFETLPVNPYDPIWTQTTGTAAYSVDETETGHSAYHEQGETQVVDGVTASSSGSFTTDIADHSTQDEAHNNSITYAPSENPLPGNLSRSAITHYQDDSSYTASGTLDSSNAANGPAASSSSVSFTNSDVSGEKDTWGYSSSFSIVPASSGGYAQTEATSLTAGYVASSSDVQKGGYTVSTEGANTEFHQNVNTTQHEADTFSSWNSNSGSDSSSLEAQNSASTAQSVHQHTYDSTDQAVDNVHTGSSNEVTKDQTSYSGSSAGTFSNGEFGNGGTITNQTSSTETSGNWGQNGGKGTVTTGSDGVSYYYGASSFDPPYNNTVTQTPTSTTTPITFTGALGGQQAFRQLHDGVAANGGVFDQNPADVPVPGDTSLTADGVHADEGAAPADAASWTNTLINVFAGAVGGAVGAAVGALPAAIYGTIVTGGNVGTGVSILVGAGIGGAITGGISGYFQQDASAALNAGFRNGLVVGVGISLATPFGSGAGIAALTAASSEALVQSGELALGMRNSYDASAIAINGGAAALGVLAGKGILALGQRIGLTAPTSFFYDSRTFSQISSQYWASNGPAAGRSLHHWLFSQSQTWVPRGVRNAGFNLVELPALRGVFHQSLGLNQWMGFAKNWAGTAPLDALLVEGAIKVGIPSVAAATGYFSYSIGSWLYENLFED